MKILTIILGVLMAICGVSCICTPAMTFLEAGYFLVILLLVYGIGAIVKAVMEKETISVFPEKLERLPELSEEELEQLSQEFGNLNRDTPILED